MLTRVVLGFGLATAIALTARRVRSLSTSGAIAATVVGTVAIAAGWAWGAMLILFFVASTLLSRFGRARKEARVGGIVAKAGERDAMQVLANGAPFALAAVGALVQPAWAGWTALGAGALAAATADTWATEIGTLAGATPRSIRTFRPVPTGTSGGVSVPGTVAMVAGALCIALAAFVASALGAAGFSTAIVGAAAGGGVVGALADSVLGGTLQARRECPACGSATERAVHGCGAQTVRAGGLAWLDNDLVNLVSTAVGAVAALAVWSRSA